MKMEAVASRKTSLSFCQTIRRYMPGDCYLDVAYLHYRSDLRCEKYLNAEYEI